MSNEQTAENDATGVPDYKGIWCELVDDAGRYTSGWGVIVHSAEVSPEALTAALRDYHGDDPFRLVSEVQHLHYTPRVKWCSRHDGLGCDNEGDWHGHWFGVKHNPASDCCHTLALAAPIPPASTDGGVDR